MHLNGLRASLTLLAVCLSLAVIFPLSRYSYDSLEGKFEATAARESLSYALKNFGYVLRVQARQKGNQCIGRPLYGKIA